MLVILVIGVTMMNNYDRMTNMETAIHQISQTLDQESTEQNQDTLEQQATEENQEALANQEAAGIAAEELGDARSNEDAAEAAGDDGEGTAEEACLLYTSFFSIYYSSASPPAIAFITLSCVRLSVISPTLLSLIHIFHGYSFAATSSSNFSIMEV